MISVSINIVVSVMVCEMLEVIVVIVLNRVIMMKIEI